MRSRVFAVIGVLSTSVLVAVAGEACVGDDPSSSSTSPPLDGSVDGTATGDGSSGNDGAAGELHIEPANIDLAPNGSVSIKITGGAPGSMVTLAVGKEDAPDGGPAAKGVSLAASSVTFAINGEATVEIKAAADATQQRFELTVAGGPTPKTVPGRVTGKPGTLDLFFGDRGGWFDFANADTEDTTANSVIVQPDGKFVVGGTGKNYQQMLIARFTADGVLDTSFATKGYVLVPGARNPRMGLFSDGSIVVAAAAPNNPKLYRLSATGSFVPGWGDSAGIDPNLTFGDLDPAFAVAKDTALVAGRPLGAADAGIAMRKYLADGGVDPTFGTGGTTQFSIGFGANIDSDRPRALAVDPTNGDIWASGSYYPGSNPTKSWVRRVNANGSIGLPAIIDTASGSAGPIVLQDLKPVLGAYDYGTASDGLSVFRVSGNSVDGAFGNGGKTKLSSQSGAGPTSIALDSDKRIYVANGGVNVVSSFEVYRLTATGTVDTTFADNGKFSMEGRAYGVAVSGRQLLVVGVDDGSNQRRARIARLWL